MTILRTLAAVVVGYVLFAALSMLVLSLEVTDGRSVLAVLVLVALALIGLVSGYAVALISGQGRRLAGYVVAGLVALATVANLVMQLGAEPVWYKLATLVLTVPAILLASQRAASRGPN